MNTTDKIYTTEELTQILETERLACVNGERTFPMPDDAEEIASETKLGSFLGAQRMFEIGCYHEFRDQVQEYQLANNISGLEVKVFVIGNKLYRFPVPICQLELTKDDYEVLKLAKDAVVDAFLSRIDEFTYLSFSHEDKASIQFDIETTSGYVKHFAEFCDWAEIIKVDDLEATINLGYGDYHASVFIASVSEAAKYSDSVWFSAAKACKNHLSNAQSDLNSTDGLTTAN